MLMSIESLSYVLYIDIAPMVSMSLTHIENAIVEAN